MKVMIPDTALFAELIHSIVRQRQFQHSKVPGLTCHSEVKHKIVTKARPFFPAESIKNDDSGGCSERQAASDQCRDLDSKV